MKKEKSLLLAVGTSIAALAMVFTLSSCSGDNGKDGADGKPGEPGTGTNGTSCTVTGVGPWTIKCGDTDVTIKVPTDGAPGESCTITGDGIDDPWTIDCGEISVPIPTPTDGAPGAPGASGESCRITGTGDDKMIICGNESIGVCKDGLYDPKKAECNAGKMQEFDAACLVDEEAGYYDYSTTTHYCKMIDDDNKEIAELCGSDKPNDYGDGTTAYNPAKYCEASWSNPTTKAFAEGTVGDCGKANEDTWKGQYCLTGEDALRTHCDFTDADHSSDQAFTAATDYCAEDKDGKWTAESTECTTDGGQPNKDVWGAQYCGKESNGDEVLMIACDTDGTVKPNEGTFKNEYCAVDNTGKWIVTNVRCNATSGPETDGSGTEMNEAEYKEFCMETVFGSTWKVADLCGGEEYGVINASGDDLYCFADDVVALCTTSDLTSNPITGFKPADNCSVVAGTTCSTDTSMGTGNDYTGCDTSY